MLSSLSLSQSRNFLSSRRLGPVSSLSKRTLTGDVVEIINYLKASDWNFPKLCLFLSFSAPLRDMIFSRSWAFREVRAVVPENCDVSPGDLDVEAGASFTLLAGN